MEDHPEEDYSEEPGDDDYIAPDEDEPQEEPEEE